MESADPLALLVSELGAVVLGEVWAGWWRCPCGRKERGDREGLVTHRVMACPLHRAPPAVTHSDIRHPSSRRITGPTEAYQEARARYDARRGNPPESAAW